jgi:signal transduction histidine kinase
MRKQFVRLFLGFVLVVAVVLGIQGAVFALSIHNQRVAWTQSVFEEYLTSLTENLKQGVGNANYSLFALEQVLLASADDRVSGLYVRNPDGTVVVAYGKTSGGYALPLPRNHTMDPARMMMETAQNTLTVTQEVVDDQGFSSREMQSDVYVVNIIHTSGVSSVMVTKQSDRQKQTILLPPQVKANDIAGSLVVKDNNEVVALVDVLTFTPFTYKDTGRLFRGLLYPFLYSIPFAFIIALFMAASISRKNQRYTQAIQDALSYLSKGENGVQLPQTKIDEQKVINASIEMLDANLLQNKKSRQAWLRSISHDLNTPVASMKLLIDGMVDGVFPLQEKTLASLKRENDSLSERIAMVVLYANLQSPEAKAQTRLLDIASFLEEVLSHFTREERERIYVDADKANVTADPKLMVQASRALLANALAASDDSVGWAIEENAMTFSNAGKLAEGVDFFEPWTRGDDSRSTPGSGLGLPIVSQVMRLHHGSATIEQQDQKVVVSLRW